MNLSGTSAIITGGGSGLGAATARALMAKGAKVTVLDVNASAAQAVAAELGGLGIACDITSTPASEAAIAQSIAAHGPLRILVNCAGIATAKKVVGREGPMPLEEFDRIIRVNLLGSFNMLRLCAYAMAGQPALAGGERGIIINTASVAAYEGQIGQAAYSASKGGIVSMTLPIARELAASGIRVMTLAPGLFLTPLLASLPQAAQDSLAAAIPFPARLGAPEEFAALAVHCAENQFLNGETIRIDGALRMAPR